MFVTGWLAAAPLTGDFTINYMEVSPAAVPSARHPGEDISGIQFEQSALPTPPLGHLR
jgi:hypothetical protein